MEIKALRWMLVAVNGAPFQNTDEARYKAKALKEIANRLDKADEKTKDKE